MPLSYSKAMDSFSKFEKFKKSWQKRTGDFLQGTTLDLQVTAETPTEVLYDDTIEVIFEHHVNYSNSRAGGCDWYRVSIFWDKMFKDYRKIGLYGYYDSDYCKMKFDGSDKLTIFSDEVTITITLP